MNFQNSEISKAILTQTLTTEIQDKGTYAAANVMKEQLLKIHRADQKLVEKTINTIIKLIYEVNFNSEYRPKFILYAEEDVDKLLAERDQILVNTGIRFKKNYYIINYKLLPEDFEIIGQNTTNFSEKTIPSFDNNIQLKEQLIDQLPDKLLQMQLESTLKPIIKLINDGESYEKIMEELAKIYPYMNTNNLEDLFSKLIFISDIMGRQTENA